MNNYMNYCIFSIKKIKTPQSVRNTLAHHSRTKAAKNADSSLVKENFFWPNMDNDDFVYDKERNGDEAFRKGNMKKAYEKFKKRFNESSKKIRKGQVLAINATLTCSQKPQNINIKEYLDTSVQWVINTFGEKNVFSISYHYDEDIPHAEVMFVPMDTDNVLCSSRLFGDREKLSSLQTQFYLACGKPFGLRRGNRREKTSYNTLKKYDINANMLEENVWNLFESLKQCLPNSNEYNNEEEYKKAYEANLNEVKKQYQTLFSNMEKMESINLEFDNLKKSLLQIQDNTVDFYLNQNYSLVNASTNRLIRCEKGVGNKLFEVDEKLNELIWLSHEDLEKVSVIMKENHLLTVQDILDKAHDNNVTIEEWINNMQINKSVKAS